MQRVFFGLEIPAEITDCLLRVRPELAGARWQSAEQLHLTSLFLGNLGKERLVAVREAARHVSLAAFLLDVVGLGCFGQPHAPKILWAGVEPEAPVISLHHEIKSRVESLGIETERRAYRPHLTLARFKGQRDSVEHLLDEHRATFFGRFQVDEFVLFESRQGLNGSVYTVLERYPLVHSVV